MKGIKPLGLWAILLALFVLPQMATAQDEPQIQQLHIQVMPEFDDPRVLVIVQGQMGGVFPQSATFLLPSEAQINQMATMDVSTGQTTPQDYDTLPDITDARWTQVTYQLDGAHFFYEFYYNPFSGEANKQFTYLFKSLLPVTDIQVEVQEPLKASNFALTPTADTTRVDGQFGFTYHQFQLGSLPAGQDVSIAINYTKTDPTPSISREQLMGMGSGGVAEVGGMVTAVAPSSAAPFPASLSTVVVAGLVGITVAVIIGRFLWLRRRLEMEPGPALAPIHTPTGQAQFCPDCGSALKANARFCHVCGRQVG